MQIQILTATPKQKPAKTPGKTYTVLELAYKNLTFQGKVEGRDLMSFGANKGAHDVLVQASPGDVFEIEVIKNAAGYNDWVSAKKSDIGATASGVTATAQPAGRSTTAVSTPAAKSTYETPEERAKKQVYIVRQSSLSNAIDMLSVGSKSPPKIDEVIAVAKDFEDFVFGTTKKPLDVETAFDSLEDKEVFDDVPV